MLAREITSKDEGGEVSVDYVAAEVARTEKRKTNVRLTPKEKIRLRDQMWALLAKKGLTTYEIAEACERAAQSERNIRRRLGRFEATYVEQAEAG